MADVSFSDNLGGGAIKGGCGLLGFVQGGFWYYVRHDNSSCKPGLWAVLLHGGDHMGEFYDMCPKAHCVVDDFGNLVRVQ